MEKKYWLLKSEPGCYSIDDLAAEPKQITSWSGVRNFQARNFLRDQIAVGDMVIFYHSVTAPSAVGVARVGQDAAVCFVKKFANAVPLKAMRMDPALAGMELLRKGSRLSVMPVSKNEFEIICRMGDPVGM